MKKKCKDCKLEKTLDCFDKCSTKTLGVESRCKVCRSIHSAKQYKENIFHFMNTLKKSKCKKDGIPYNLDEDYLKSIWSDACPIFGVILVSHDKTNGNQYALDRIDPNLGYVKGNVAFICSRANRIKYDATIEELELILNWMKEKTKD